jgi:FkbM family methyltransferase
MIYNDIKNLITITNPIIFEIGCADGVDTRNLLNLFPYGDFYCFEPEPNNIELFKNKFKYDHNIKLYEGVISNITSDIIFNRSRTDNPNDLRYSGSIKNPKKHKEHWPSIFFDEQITVNSSSLDNFCQNNNINNIDFIWADVQGTEKDLILGGSETLSKKVKYFYTEYYNEEIYENQINLNETIELLGDNWELLFDYGTDALFRNKNVSY